MANPAVREEIEKIIGFWLQLGVSGFRMDAAPFIIELTTPNDPNPRKDFDWLDRLSERASWSRGDAVILAEANVEREELLEYFGHGDRLPMLFNFMLNQRTFLALAREEAAPLVQGLTETPASPTPANGRRSCATMTRSTSVDSWATNARRCWPRSDPEPEMQLYERGIRRRLAPMLGNDRRRIEMAYALQFSLPGTPVIRYGDELGMGDDLSLRERDGLRTPMQWADEPNAGFSTASIDALRRPVISSGDYGYERVNVADQAFDSDSLLAWFERALRTLRSCPEFGIGEASYIDAGVRSVLALTPRRAGWNRARADELGRQVLRD